MSEQSAVAAQAHPALAQLAALNHLRVYVDVGVVVVVLAITNLIAHFSTPWASIAVVPAAAAGLVLLVRARGLGWAELGLGREHWRSGTRYALAAVALLDIILRDEVGHVAIGNRWYGYLCGLRGLDLAALGCSAATLHAAFDARYAGERFIRVMPLRDAATLEDGFYDVQACNDSNRAEIFVFANDTQALLMARLDNLGKGASGAAVQNMNLALGLLEAAGLG